MKEQLHADDQRGKTGHPCRYKPGTGQQTQCGGRQQTAPQIIKYLPAVEQGERVDAATLGRVQDMRQNPAGYLPVPTNPAMGAFAVTLIPLGKFIVQFNITGQTHSDMGPFDQVVTEHPLFREALGKNATEGPDIIDALAVVRSFPAQILIHIRDRLGVGINADGIGKEPAEN